MATNQATDDNNPDRRQQPRPRQYRAPLPRSLDTVSNVNVYLITVCSKPNSDLVI